MSVSSISLVAESWRLLVRSPAQLALSVAPPFAASLAAASLPFLSVPYGGLLAQLVQVLALGMFGVAWTRYAALGENPASGIYHFGLRQVLYGVWYKILAAFAAVPLLVMPLLFGEDAIGQAELHPQLATALVIAVQQVFLALVGMLWLVLPNAALGEKGVGANAPGGLHSRVRRGGMAVGIGLVAATLPFTVLMLGLDDLLPRETEFVAPALLAEAAAGALSFLAGAVTAGYLGKAWGELAGPKAA